MSIPSIELFLPCINDLDAVTNEICNPALSIMVSNLKSMLDSRSLQYDLDHARFLEIVQNFDRASQFNSSEILSTSAWINFIKSESESLQSKL